MHSPNYSPLECLWIEQGLCGMLEIMEASCELSERLTQDCVDNPAVRSALVKAIADEIKSRRE